MLWHSISRRNAFTTIPFTRYLVLNASKSSSNNSQGDRTVIRLCSEEVISGFFLCEIQMPCSAISVIPCASQPEVSGLEHGPTGRYHHSLFEFLLWSSPDLPALSRTPHWPLLRISRTYRDMMSRTSTVNGPGSSRPDLTKDIAIIGRLVSF